MAGDAGFHDVRIQFLAPPVEHRQFLGRRHTAAMGGEAGTEHVGDQTQICSIANRARELRRGAHVGGRSDQLRVGVAHLVLAKPAPAVLVDERLAGETMIDLAARVC